MTLVSHDIHGPGDATHTVLLSSGLGGSAGFWRPQIPALVDAGYRVIAYDQRGTGRTGGPLPDGYTIAHMAQDVRALLAATGTARCHFAGHALGGLVGLQLALDAPEVVASLCLINAWAQPNAHSGRCFDTRLALLDLGTPAGPAAYVRAQPLFLYPPTWALAHTEAIDAEVAHALAHFPGEVIMRQRISALRAFDVSAQLPAIAAPALVMCAQDDLLVPWTMSEQLAQGLPNAELISASSGGHAHSVTDPEPFNQALLAFLARQAKLSRP